MTVSTWKPSARNSSRALGWMFSRSRTLISSLGNEVLACSRRRRSSGNGSASGGSGRQDGTRLSPAQHPSRPRIDRLAATHGEVAVDDDRLNANGATRSAPRTSPGQPQSQGRTPPRPRPPRQTDDPGPVAALDRRRQPRHAMHRGRQVQHASFPDSAREHPRERAVCPGMHPSRGAHDTELVRADGRARMRDGSVDVHRIHQEHDHRGRATVRDEGIEHQLQRVHARALRRRGGWRSMSRRPAATRITRPRPRTRRSGVRLRIACAPSRRGIPSTKGIL